MTEPAEVPTLRAFSPTMRVDALVSDWRAARNPKLSSEEQERELYGQAWEAYLEGDFGFGLWCWHECDRLTNAFIGAVREVTRVLGPGRYFGFSHRRAVAEKVPVEKIYRPRKGDMSTPRTDAIILPQYQLLCVYLVRAHSGDPKAKAQLEIALGEHEDRRRADAFGRHFDTFKRLLERPPAPESAAASPSAGASVPALSAPPPDPAATGAKPGKRARKGG
ncbi:MAG TPA: hypothetical protein VIZ68_05925 [Thermoplasmata archaeon]